MLSSKGPGDPYYKPSGSEPLSTNSEPQSTTPDLLSPRSEPRSSASTGHPTIHHNTNPASSERAGQLSSSKLDGAQHDPTRRPPDASDATSSFSASSDPSAPLTPLQQAFATRRATASASLSNLIDALQNRMLGASATLNSMTGYTPIERIKAENEILEHQLHALQTRVRAARAAYKSANTRRAATQREVTALLARKDAWSPTDLERFTTIYRDDHVIEHEVADAATELAEAEAAEQSIGARLNQGILRRYHEEQVWSDRIRRASTWGTWGLMGVNVLLFLGLQFVAEPWRRRRLVKGVVDEERGVMAEVREQLALVRDALDRTEARARNKVVGRKERERLEQEAAAAAAEIVAAHEAEQRRVAERDAVVAATPERASTDPRRSRRRQSVVYKALTSLGSATGVWSHAAAINWADTLTHPGATVVPVIEDLVSERRADLRMRDVSLVAVEGLVAGMALGGGLCALVLACR